MRTVLLLCAVTPAAAVLTLDSIPPATGSLSPPAGLRKPFVAFNSGTRVLWVFGGQLADGTFTDSTWTYTIDSTYSTGTWAQLNPTTRPPARYYGVAGLLPDGSFIIASGEGTGKTFYNDAWVLSPLAAGWTEVQSTTRFDARYGSAGGVIDGELYVSHGFASERFSDTWRLTSAGWVQRHESISEYSANNPHPRCLVASAVLSGRSLVMFGGCANGGKSGGPCPAQDTWAFDEGETGTDATWTRGQDGPIPLQHGAMAQIATSTVLLWGGSNNKPQVITVADNPTNLAMLYELTDREWKAVTMTLGSGAPTNQQDGHSMVSAGTGRVLILGTEGSAATVWTISGDMNTAPQSGELKTYWSLLHIHAIFMFMAWGVLLQFGSIMFRYYRHLKWSFLAHQIANTTGLVFTIIGFALAFAGGGSPNFAHGIIGILVFVLALIQPLAAAFRCHKPEPDGEEHGNLLCGVGWGGRWVFNLIHHICGRSALVLGLVNITLGIPLLIPPDVWYYWGFWWGWMGMIAIIYILCEIGTCAGWMPKHQITAEEIPPCCRSCTDAPALTKGDVSGDQEAHQM
eukprot:TRINITY_DN55091_c0_g1_i1.p1 TRINITY_DN55091_c0_g1~~TRINITY_DN55091_c0_g1_i1.p1  ORF type:complete len:601 (+),score=186.46 TRINITY_DN55091_c0_g1_i1:89-1804(+)